MGLRLLLLTGVRTGELRLATPDQFDLERGLWIIPPTVVKQLQLKLRNENRRSDTIPPYIVPLSVQALEIIRFMLERMKPAQHYLFTHASNLKKRISENTLNGALKRMGYKDQLTGHGIRATLSTALNEIGYPKPWIEAQLSHSDPNKVSAAYNHAEYIEQRRHMMQDWADRLDLFEQNLVDAASRVLTVHLEGVPELDETEIEAKEKVEPVISAPTLTVMLQETENAPVIPESGQRLSAVKGPRPVMSDSQRRRQEMLNIFNSSQVVTAADYAKMVGKSRRWISYEIQRRRVLALKIGNLGHRIPGWHFEPLKHKLIQAVLKQCGEVDPWQIHGVLSEPREDLDGRPPIEAVTEHGFHEVALEVCLALKG